MAWIYPGPHNDQGWSQAHDAGRLMVQKALGSKVQTTYKENVFSNAQRPADRRRSRARRLHDDLRDCSFGKFSNGVNGQLVRQVPERDLRAGDRPADQEEPGRVLRRGRGHDLPLRHGRRRGAARRASSATWCPFGIPEVVRHLNAFTLGAQATHPGARVKLIWTNAWYSPPKETSAAQNLIAAGVDVIGQNVDSPAAGVVAESKHGSRGSGTTRTRRSRHRSSG